MHYNYTQHCPVCGGSIVYWDKCPDGWTYCENEHQYKVRVCRAKYSELKPTRRIGYALAGWEVVQWVGPYRWNVEVIEYIPEAIGE